MKKEELIKKLLEIEQDDSDIEEYHITADELLLEYISDDDVREAYEKGNKWYA